MFKNVVNRFLPKKEKFNEDEMVEAFFKAQEELKLARIHFQNAKFNQVDQAIMDVSKAEEEVNRIIHLIKEKEAKETV